MGESMTDDFDREGPREGPETTAETLQRISDPALEAVGAAADRTAETARSGYKAASGKMADCPLVTAFAIAAAGIAIGWVARGAAEEKQRESWSASVWDAIRRR